MLFLRVNFAVAMLFFLCVPIDAANAAIGDTRISVTSEYETNQAMLVENEQAHSLGRIEFDQSLALQVRNSQLRAEIGLKKVRKNGSQDLSYDDNDITLSWNVNGYRVSYGSLWNYRQDTTINSESDTTGLIEREIEHEQLVATPFAEYRILETVQLNARLNYSADRYEKREDILFSDYDTRSLEVGAHFYISPILSLNTSAFSSDLELDDSQQPIENGTLSIGERLQENDGVSLTVDWQPFKTQRLTTSWSRRRSRSAQDLTFFQQFDFFGQIIENIETEKQSSEEFGHSFSLNWQQKLKQSTVSLLASQELVPSSRGYIERKSLTVSYSQRFTQRFSSSFSLRAFENEDLTQDDRSAYSLQLHSLGMSMSYSIDRNHHVSMSFSYKLREIDREEIRLAEDEQAESESITFRYSYNLTKKH